MSSTDRDISSREKGMLQIFNPTTVIWMHVKQQLVQTSEPMLLFGLFSFSSVDCLSLITLNHHLARKYCLVC